MHFIDFDSLKIYGQNEYPEQFFLTYHCHFTLFSKMYTKIFFINIHIFKVFNRFLLDLK